MPRVVIPKDFIMVPSSNKLRKPKVIPASPKAAWNNSINEMREKFPSMVMQLQKQSGQIDKVKQALQKQKESIVKSIGSLEDIPNGPVKSATMALSLCMAGCYLGMLDGAISFVFENSQNVLGQFQKTLPDAETGLLLEALEEHKSKTVVLMKDMMKNGKVKDIQERHNSSLQKIGDSINSMHNMSKQSNRPLSVIEYQSRLGNLFLGSYTAGIRDAFLYFYDLIGTVSSNAAFSFSKPETGSGPK